MMGLQLGFLVGGAVLTETVYAYPGVGRLIYESVTQLDYPCCRVPLLYWRRR